MNRAHLSRILSCCGIFAPPTIVIAIIVAGLLTPGYNQFTDTISSLCGQDSQRPELMIAGFLSFGVLIIGFSYGLYLGLDHSKKARIIWFTLTLYGIGMILAGIFRDCPDNTIPINMEGILHDCFVAAAFISLLIGMCVFTKSVNNKPSWFGFTWFTITATAMSLALSIIFLLQLHVPYPGLLQRIFNIIPLIWIEMVSIWLFRLSLKY
jgi:hypothetical membrane protein